jgi:hypothetical protein
LPIEIIWVGLIELELKYGELGVSNGDADIGFTTSAV